MRRLRTVIAAASLVAFGASAGPALAATSHPGRVSPQAFAQAEVAYYARQLPETLQASGSGIDNECLSATDSTVAPDVVNGYPTNPAWFERDGLNQYCATLRLRDQLTNPAYGAEVAQQGSALWLQQLGDQISGAPGHIHGGLTTLVPGSQAADAFRTAGQWEALTGGRVIPVDFTAADGARLEGNVWLPPPGTPTFAGGRYPGVVITEGSVQGYQNLYYWAAEGLAQYGYEVLTYDVQGQGDSDLLAGGCPNPANLPGCTTGVPYQQDYNFYQGAEDSLSYFLSTPARAYHGTYNPGWAVLDAGDVGIAGHSLGASAVSWAGQCDRRVKAIVAWDDLAPVTMSNCAANVTVAPADQAALLHTPALALTNDYEFNPQPNLTVPNPNGSGNGGGLDGTAGYLSLASAGVDSQIVSIRNGTHLTYSYIPYVLPANQVGERVAFYYTLAWFDEYLRGGNDPRLVASDTAYGRLTSLGTYDQSADRSDSTNPGAADISFGAGTYNMSQALADPTDPGAGNVPYEIDGIPILNTLSFYYYSEYRLHDPQQPGDPIASCSDMLARCPATQPSTP